MCQVQACCYTELFMPAVVLYMAHQAPHVDTTLKLGVPVLAVGTMPPGRQFHWSPVLHNVLKVCC